MGINARITLVIKLNAYGRRVIISSGSLIFRGGRLWINLHNYFKASLIFIGSI